MFQGNGNEMQMEQINQINQNQLQDLKKAEKKYQCEKCTCAFRRNDDFRAHMRTHTGERPYVCLVCKASFTQSGNLARHRRVHTGERPFTCEICQNKFTTSSHLSRHRSTHRLASLERLPVISSNHDMLPSPVSDKRKMLEIEDFIAKESKKSRKGGKKDQDS